MLLSRVVAVRELYAAAQARDGRKFTEDEFAPYLPPWMRTLLSIDSRQVLRQVRCPVLALVGDKDQVVRGDANIPALARALAANPQARVDPLLKQEFAPSFTQIGLITLTFQCTASILQPSIGLYTDKRPLPFMLPAGMCVTLSASRCWPPPAASPCCCWPRA